MQSVVHFEMPYEDSARASKFYGEAFGWKTEQMGEDMGNYVVVTTTESDPKTRMPKAPGAINGGLFKKDPANSGISFVVAVDDIQDAMKKVVAAGGKITGGMEKQGQPDMIPGVGLYIAVEDTEGNRVSLLQPKM